MFFSHRTRRKWSLFFPVAFIFRAVKRLAALHILLQESKIGVDRLAQILTEKPTVQEKSNARALRGFSSAIRFRDVSFAYDTQSVLEGIDLEIKRGLKIGIAGENGSGKSTLVNLLLRFYDPTSGAVEIDGIACANVRVSDLRDLIGLAVRRWSSSISRSPEYGCARRELRRRKSKSAARSAGCHDFIIQAQEGYAHAGRRARVLLSGGQRQRVSIAAPFIPRCPYHNPG